MVFCRSFVLNNLLFVVLITFKTLLKKIQYIFFYKIKNNYLFNIHPMKLTIMITLTNVPQQTMKTEIL